jgi:undecaprenyl-diphosphatase
MSYLDAVILGIIQGLTEFLPVSSSGHLVLSQKLLEVDDPGVSFEILVHVATLFSVLIYFRGRISAMVRSLFDTSLPEARRLILYILVGTIPAVVIGLLLKDQIESAFESPLMASAMLIVTGLILLSTRLAPRQTRPLGPGRALAIGVGQALAILPGISRSGTTITAGMLLGVAPDRAAEFSFLLAIPAIAGAAVLDIGDLSMLPSANLGPYLVGGVVAFAVALVAVYLVLEAVRRGRFQWFGYYCLAAGGLGLYLFL